METQLVGVTLRIPRPWLTHLKEVAARKDRSVAAQARRWIKLHLEIETGTKLTEVDA